MLNQYPHKALNRPKYHPVDHDRAVFFSILTDILCLKTLRQLKIKLDRSALPCPSKRILQMEINFRPVKCPIALIDNIGQPQILQRILQTIRRHLPILIAPDGILWPCRQFHMVLKAEIGIHLIDQPYHSFDLVRYLCWCHKNMGIVLRAAADTHQTVQSTRLFIPVDQSQFTNAQRKIAVGMWFHFIHKDSTRAAHRLNGKIRPVNYCCIHIFPVMFPMPGRFPEFPVQDDWG